MTHLPEFIFKPGKWIGEGKITFTPSPEFVKFYTRWEVAEEHAGFMHAKQTVEMVGVEEHVVNEFTFYDITPESFSVLLSNELIGSLKGTGIIDATTIAWEFRGTGDNFEGFEVYKLQENGDYSLHAEYASSDQFRTTIQGLIWKKSN